MSTYHDNTDILRRRADILKRELYSQCLHQIEFSADFEEYLCMKNSTENATPPKSTRSKAPDSERWGAGVETQKNVRGEIGGWGRVPFNETYAPSLSTIYDGA